MQLSAIRGWHVFWYDRAWAKGASLMVDDCLNRFWLLARAVGDNGSPLRPIVARQSLS